MSIQPKVALVYDKVNTKYGGAEVVLKTLCELYPDAPLFTSIYNRNRAIWAKNFQVRTSFLQKIPLLNKNHQILTPLMPLAFESHDFNKFDVIISVTSGEAKGIITKPNQLHVCYLLTPSRYLYSHAEEYINRSGIFSLPIIKQLAKLLLKYLRWWDQVAINRPDHLIVISNLIKERVKKYYQREVEAIIYPPSSPKKPISDHKLPINNYLLCVSRLVPYKKIDLCVKASAKLKQTLIIAGTGEDQNRLQKLFPELTFVRGENETIDQAMFSAKKSNKTIIFLDAIEDEEVAQLFLSAKALLMPGLEDFGITALDASSWGVPTVLAKDSGVAELLGENCYKLGSVNLDELIEAIKKIDDQKINSEALKRIAKNSSPDNFSSQFKKIVYDLIIQHQLKGPNVYL